MVELLTVNFFRKKPHHKSLTVAKTPLLPEKKNETNYLT